MSKNVYFVSPLIHGHAFKKKTSKLEYQRFLWVESMLQL